MEKEINYHIGCNYHTTWQTDKAMRFILVRIEGSTAWLRTRVTKKYFPTDISTLIFIESEHNKRKAGIRKVNFKNESETKRVSHRKS